MFSAGHLFLDIERRIVESSPPLTKYHQSKNIQIAQKIKAFILEISFLFYSNSVDDNYSSVSNAYDEDNPTRRKGEVQYSDPGQ
jgi:hypothetical protein